MKILHDQEREFGELIHYECTNPEVSPPESRTDTIPASSPSDVYLIVWCVLGTLTGGKPWKGVSRDVARVLVSASRLPPKPESISGEKWQLIEATCAVDPVKRMEMAHVVEKLRQFAQEVTEPKPE